MFLDLAVNLRCNSKMDIHSFRVYLALCKHLHFGKTSLEFHMSPSSLSRLIQKLEHSVGQPLLMRDNRSVALTPQGEQFRVYAQDAVADWEEMQRTLQASSERLSGTLRLFASVTASMSILPDVMSRFREEHPDIHIQLETGYAVDAIQRLSEGSDVVVASLSQEEDPNLEKNIVTSTPIVAVALPELIDGSDTGSLDWQTVPLVLPGFGQVRDAVDIWLRVQNIAPNIYTEVDGNEAILSLVALGCGLGFVPQLVIDNSPLKDRVNVVEGMSFGEFHVGFCTRPKQLRNSAIIRAFWSSI